MVRLTCTQLLENLLSIRVSHKKAWKAYAPSHMEMFQKWWSILASLLALPEKTSSCCVSETCKAIWRVASFGDYNSAFILLSFTALVFRCTTSVGSESSWSFLTMTVRRCSVLLPGHYATWFTRAARIRWKWRKAMVCPSSHRHWGAAGTWRPGASFLVSFNYFVPSWK